MPLPQKRCYHSNNDSVLRSAHLEHDQNSNEQTTNEIRGIFRHENHVKEKKNHMNLYFSYMNRSTKFLKPKYLKDIKLF